jgi:[ribosomal protein S5]-alanine N-acetyltransferase
MGDLDETINSAVEHARESRLNTPRLALRALSEEDAPFILGLLNEPSFIRNIGDRGVRTIEDAVAYIENGPLVSYARFGFGLYLVTLNNTGASIGICGILKRDALPEPDIGFAFLPAYWSQGYALESATAVKDYARTAIGLPRLLAIVNPSNSSSIRLLEKLGFAYESMTRLSGEAHDVKLYTCAL